MPSQIAAGWAEIQLLKKPFITKSQRRENHKRKEKFRTFYFLISRDYI
jgi:hypothetical protein